MEDQLIRFREQLDNIDNEIIYLVKRRLQVVQKIGKYKNENNMEIYQPDREAEMFNKLSAKAVTMGINENFIQNLFDIIIEESKKEQKKAIDKQNLK